MGPADRGIHKPFDRIFKAFADEAPGIVLDLAGSTSGAGPPGTTPLRPESAPPVVLPDVVLRIDPATGKPHILHLEFELDFRVEELATIARQGGSLAFQYRMWVDSVMFLLKRSRAPARIPKRGRAEIHGTELIHPFRVVRAWELDPGVVLRSGEVRLLPWAVVMKTTDAEVEALAAVVRRSGDEEAIGRFLTLGGLRYDRDRLERMLGGVAMGLEEAIVRGSSIFVDAMKRNVGEAAKRARAEGREQGREEGRDEGVVLGVRNALRTILMSRMPGLEAMPEIDRISDPSALDDLLGQACAPASDRDSLERAIRAAAGRHA